MNDLNTPPVLAMLLPDDTLATIIKAAHRSHSTSLRGAVGHLLALDTHHRALCCSLMMVFQSVDQGWLSFVFAESAEGEMAHAGMEQLRAVLTAVNSCPDFLDDPTPEEIAAMRAEPGYQAMHDRILARGMEIFAEAVEKSKAVTT